MKVALLFAGQYRKNSKELFRNSLNIFTENLDFNIFSFCWKEIGTSLDHREEVKILKSDNNIDLEIKQLFDGYNLYNHNSECFKDFQSSLQNSFSSIQDSKIYHPGTIRALPQLYSLQKCYELMRDSKIDYDLIFRCRYDSLFLHPLNLYPLEKIYMDNFLYNINFGRAYYPYRVYDIFFGGSYKSMRFLENIFLDFPQLVHSNFKNGLDNRDCCRLIYLSSIKNGIQVKSFKSRICDVFRIKKDFYYERYILSSHFISIIPFKNNLKIISYFKKWILRRKIPKVLVINSIFQTSIRLPINYLKRIYYFLIYLRNLKFK